MEREPPTLVKALCHYCHIPSDHLDRCPVCRVVWYCRGEHDSSDLEAHGRVCNTISKARHRLGREESQLRDFRGDELTDSHPFQNAVGHFWEVLQTRDYMRARLAHVESLLQVNTSDALEMALDEMMDMLRLNRGDNMGVKDLAPAVMIRLDRDQEAYDFMKWWAIIAEDNNYNLGNVDSSPLHVKNADLFEVLPKAFVRESSVNINQSISLLLLNVKVFLDLAALNRPEKLNRQIPLEVLNEIRKRAPRSPIVANDLTLMEARNINAAIFTMTQHIDKLYETIKHNNKYVWPAFLDPPNDPQAPLGMYTPGSREEMELALKNCHRAWLETPGAVEFINSKTLEST